MRNEDDFLYALREDMPEDFAQNLYEQLNEAEHHMTTVSIAAPKAGRQTRILPFVAALITLALLSLTLMYNTPPMPPPAQAFTLDDLQPITDQNAANLEMVERLGDGLLKDFAWSPDGETLALATSNGIYLAQRDDLGGELLLLSGRHDAASRVMYNHAGDMLASIHGDDLELRDPASGEVLRRIENSGEYLLGFSPDDQRIATAGYKDEAIAGYDEYAVYFWNVATGEQERFIPVSQPWGIQLNADWSLLAYPQYATIMSEAVLYLINVPTGEHSTLPSSRFFTFSPDGSLLIAAPFTSEASIRVYETADVLAGLNEESFAGRGVSLVSAFVFQIALHPNNHHLFVNTAEGNFIYDMESRDEISQLQTEVWWIGNSAFSPEGDILATLISGRKLVLWDWRTGENVGEIARFDPQFHQIHFNDDSTLLLAAPMSGYGGQARLWDLIAPSPTESVIAAQEDPQDNLVFADFLPGTDDVVISQSLSDGGTTYTFWRHKTATGEQEWMASMRGASYHVGLTDDARLLWLSGESNRARQIFPETEGRGVRLEDVGEWNYLSSEIRAAHSPDGRLLIGSICLQRPPYSTVLNQCFLSELRVWNLQTGELIGKLEGGRYHFSRAFAFTADGQMFASAQCASLVTERTFEGNDYLTCSEPVARLWKLTEFYEAIEAGTPAEPEYAVEIFASLPHEENELFGLAFSPLQDDSLLLASQDGEQLRLWNVDSTTGEFTLLHTAPSSGRDLAFSPDGRMIAVAGDGLAWLWGTGE